MDLNSDNKDAIDYIKKHNPYQIDWSNIPDYMKNTDFLRLAKLCCVEDTLHTCHFINWPCMVYGTHLYDYTGKQ